MQGTEEKAKKTAGKRDAYHHGDLRAGLVEATRQLVEEKGPDRFSVSDACRLAGVSTAAPYRHFSDREEMLLAVVMEALDRFFEDMHGAAQAHPRGSVEAIVALGNTYVNFAIREPGVFRLVFGLSQRQGFNDEKSQKGMRIYGVLLDQVAGYFGRAEIDDMVHHRAFPLWTFVHGLCFLLLDDKTAELKLDVAREKTIAETTRLLLAN